MKYPITRMLFILMAIVYFAIALAYFGWNPFWILAPGLGGIILNKIAQRKLRDYYYGVGFLKLGNVPKALKNFESFIADVNANPGKLKWQAFATTNTLFSYREIAMFYKGVCQFDLEHYETAKETFNKLLQERPDFVECYLNLAGIAIKQEDTQGAIDWLAQAKPYVNRKFQRIVREASFMKEIAEDARVKELLAMKPPTDVRKVVEYIAIGMLTAGAIALVVYYQLQG